MHRPTGPSVFSSSGRPTPGSYDIPPLSIWGKVQEVGGTLSFPGQKRVLRLSLSGSPSSCRDSHFSPTLNGSLPVSSVDHVR